MYICTIAVEGLLWMDNEIKINKLLHFSVKFCLDNLRESVVHQQMLKLNNLTEWRNFTGDNMQEPLRNI